MATADYFLILVVAVCTYTDFTCRKIYNAVLFPAAAVGLVGNFYAGGPAGGLAALKGLTLGMALLFVPFIMGGMGAGDVKLLGVVGAFKGPDFVWAAFLVRSRVRQLCRHGSERGAGQSGPAARHGPESLALTLPWLIITSIPSG